MALKNRKPAIAVLSKTFNTQYFRVNFLPLTSLSHSMHFPVLASTHQFAYPNIQMSTRLPVLVRARSFFKIRFYTNERGGGGGNYWRQIFTTLLKFFFLITTISNIRSLNWERNLQSEKLVVSARDAKLSFTVGVSKNSSISYLGFIYFFSKADTQRLI